MHLDGKLMKKRIDLGSNTSLEKKIGFFVFPINTKKKKKTIQQRLYNLTDLNNGENKEL